MRLFKQLTLALVMLFATQVAIAQINEPCSLMLKNGLYKTFDFRKTGKFEQDLKSYFTSESFKDDVRNHRWSGDLNVTAVIDGAPTPIGLGANANNDEITKFQEKIASATSLTVSQSFLESALTSIPDVALAKVYSECVNGRGLKHYVDIGDSLVTFSIIYKVGFSSDKMPIVGKLSVVDGVILSSTVSPPKRFLRDSSTVIVRRLPGKELVFALDTDKGSVSERIRAASEGPLQNETLRLPVEGFPSSCADPSNTDRQGFTNPNCTWFSQILVPKGDRSEFEVSLKLTVGMTNTSLDGGGCSDPHRQAEVFLKYGSEGELHSGMLGQTNVNQATQEYSLTALFKTSNKPVLVKVFINPRGCTKVTLKSGELNFKEVRQ